MEKGNVAVIAFLAGLLILGYFIRSQHPVSTQETLIVKGMLQELPVEVIIPASDFLGEIPKGNIIVRAAELEAPWISFT